MGRCTAKIAAPWTMRVVGIGSRVDQELQAADRQCKREGVRMPVRGDAPVAHRPRIGDQADFTVGFEVATEDVIAACRKCLPQRKPRPCRALRLEQSIRLAAEEPTRLVVQSTCFEPEITSLEQDRPGCKQRSIGGRITARSKPADKASLGTA